MNNQERVKITAKDNMIDFRVHCLCTNYEFEPTVRGFTIPLASIGDFIKSIESVEAYAILKGV